MNRNIIIAHCREQDTENDADSACDDDMIAESQHNIRFLLVQAIYMSVEEKRQMKDERTIQQNLQQNIFP